MCFVMCKTRTSYIICILDKSQVKRAISPEYDGLDMTSRAGNLSTAGVYRVLQRNTRETEGKHFTALALS